MTVPEYWCQPGKPYPVLQPTHQPKEHCILQETHKHQELEVSGFRKIPSFKGLDVPSLIGLVLCVFVCWIVFSSFQLL